MTSPGDRCSWKTRHLAPWGDSPGEGASWDLGLWKGAGAEAHGGREFAWGGAERDGGRAAWQWPGRVGERGRDVSLA